MKRVVDLRSDTCSMPTQKMLEAMRNAEVGNADYGEDPTVNKLQEIAAKKLGKEAAIFIPSGTMGNQAAIMTHTSNKGDEIITGAQSHLYLNEVGGYASLSNASVCLIPDNEGFLPPDKVEQAIRKSGLTQPRTTLICLENTHNRAGGRVVYPENFKSIRKVADKHNVSIHLDGERLFEAIVYLGIDAREITQYVDSVMIGLSKDLCCPVGSILAGKKEFIEKAWKNVKLLGGVMRQAGYIAAPGIIALEEMIERLKEDQQKAKRIACSLENYQQIHLDINKVETNIIKFGVKGNGWDAPRFSKRMNQRGILCNAIDDLYIRMVVYRDITESDIDYTIKQIKEVFEEN